MFGRFGIINRGMWLHFPLRRSGSVIYLHNVKNEFFYCLLVFLPVLISLFHDCHLRA